MKDWKKIIIKKTDSVLTTLEVLNKVGTKFVVVADDGGVILGTVSDGDIRRGLLKGINLNDQVEKVMNTSPKTLPTNTPHSAILKIMKDNAIQYIPLVNELKIITSVVSTEDVSVPSKKENHVVLMAGGLGSRLAKLTSECPKPMLNVGGKPILEAMIEILKSHGFYKFVLAVNYKSDMIENHFKDGSQFGCQITYLKEETRLGTAGALSLYKPNDLPFVVMNADLLTKINFSDLLDFHNTHQNMSTVCLRQHEHQIPFGVVITDQDRVLKIEEKPVRRYFVNGGIYVLSPDALRTLPNGSYYDMPTLVEDLISQNQKVGAYPFYEYWIDIGSLDDYQRAHTEFLDVFK